MLFFISVFAEYTDRNRSGIKLQLHKNNKALDPQEYFFNFFLRVVSLALLSESIVLLNYFSVNFTFAEFTTFPHTKFTPRFKNLKSLLRDFTCFIFKRHFSQWKIKYFFSSGSLFVAYSGYSKQIMKTQGAFSRCTVRICIAPFKTIEPYPSIDIHGFSISIIQTTFFISYILLACYEILHC
jgi:hypothetical protein